MKLKEKQLRLLIRQAILESKSLDPTLKYDTPLYKRLRKDSSFQNQASASQNTLLFIPAYSTIKPDEIALFYDEQQL